MSCMGWGRRKLKQWKGNNYIKRVYILKASGIPIVDSGVFY